MVVCSFPGLGQNALSLSLGTTAPTSAASNEGLGGIDFSTSSDKKSKWRYFSVVFWHHG